MGDGLLLPSDLTARRGNPPVHLLDEVASRRLNPDAFVAPIVWGWKRDHASPRFSRLVYFSGRHIRDAEGSAIADPFLFYAHLGPDAGMRPVVRQLEGWSRHGGSLTADSQVLQPVPGTTLVRIVSGRPGDADLDRLRRLAARRPDHPRPTPPRVPSSTVFDLHAHGITGCDVLAGSGLSYEAGLPALKEVHDLFWVDDGYEAFCLGDSDQLPALLRNDLEKTIRSFASWHVQAASVQPSQAHRCIRSLRDAGFVKNVYTDNIDRLFDLVGIRDYVRVRGSGVVNEFHPVTFHPDADALLVVGVSADRRGIIQQARSRGLRIVPVNPYLPVSPGARNLDYLQPGDVFFRLPAGEALPRILAETLHHGAGRQAGLTSG